MRTAPWLLLLFGCHAPSPSPSHPAWTWSTTPLPPLGLTVAAFPQLPVSQDRWPEGGVASQSVTREGDRVTWLLRAAPDERLDGFRDDHKDWAFSETTTRVCDQPVKRVVATHDAEQITCVITATGNHPAWIPPRRAVAIELRHRGRHVVVSFETEAADLAGWRPIEDEFFAALRCP
jgi:hypothetical protein